MTEQVEDDFWAQERARDTAARGQHADPSACGTCRAAVEAGGQVKHDECAQRAILLPAPDAPGYELITGMSEEEVQALPARFHHPVFMESSTPQLWVCAVCWGDGWSTQWPCKTATEQGTQVFTPEHQAETTAKRQTAELEQLRQERDELQARVTELEAQRERRRIRLVALDNDALNMRGSLSPMGEDRKVPFPLGETLTPAVDWLIARVAELETDLERTSRPSYSQRHVWSVWREDQPIHAFYGTIDDARQGSIDCWEEDEPVCPDYSWKPDGPRLELVVGGETSGVYISRHDVFGSLAEPEKELAEARADLARYVGHEPTIADEMAYLTRCLDTVHDLCDLAKQRNRATVTVAELELSLNCEWQAPTPRPALPWAHAMEASDLHLFLDDLVSAALNRWRTDVDGPVPDRETLAAIEKACTDWRTPGQGLRSDEPGTKGGEDR